MIRSALIGTLALNVDALMHPNDSLNKLEKNINHWIDRNLDKESIESKTGKSRMRKMTNNMRNAFARDQCGFFDSSMTNGGPDLNPELRPNGKPRMRRSISGQPEGGEPNILAYSKKNRLLGLQQILLGYRYWAERHINECHGQRKFNYIAKRGQKLVRHTW